jgi:hypothetical protein
MNHADPSQAKRRALKELNAETRDVQVALNQAQVSLQHALRLRLVEDTYQKKRTSIINAPDDELEARP